ncbi:MAG: hypothetical protein J6A33_00865 [Alphaproteobacteria bacterium]|nr:hypothetical protein [Alphaproteobacteria bacterium]
MDEEKKKHWSLRFLLACLKSPVTFALIALCCYFLFQAYVLGNSAFINKAMALGCVLLWFFWFLAKNMLKLFLILVVIGLGFYGYYSVSRQEIVKCEESGGVWNKETKTCEAKLGFMEKLEKLWNQYTGGKNK